MKKPYTVKGTTRSGEKHEIKSCCERDAVTRLSMLSPMMMLKQPDDMPRTCEEHAYEGQGNDA